MFLARLLVYEWDKLLAESDIFPMLIKHYQWGEYFRHKTLRSFSPLVPHYQGRICASHVLPERQDLQGDVIINSYPGRSWWVVTPARNLEVYRRLSPAPPVDAVHLAPTPAHLREASFLTLKHNHPGGSTESYHLASDPALALASSAFLSSSFRFLPNSKCIKGTANCHSKERFAPSVENLLPGVSSVLAHINFYKDFLQGGML